MKNNDSDTKNKTNLKSVQKDFKDNDNESKNPAPVKKKTTDKTRIVSASNGKPVRRIKVTPNKDKIEDANSDLLKSTVCKGDLVSYISQMVGQSQELVKDVIDTLIQSIKTTIENGGSVYISGFIKFGVKLTNKKTLTNPKTGETIHVPAKNKIYAKPGKELKEAALEAPLATAEKPKASPTAKPKASPKTTSTGSKR